MSDETPERPHTALTPLLAPHSIAFEYIDESKDLTRLAAVGPPFLVIRR